MLKHSYIFTRDIGKIFSIQSIDALMIKGKATLYSKANAPCKHLFQIFQLVPLEKNTKFLTIESLQPTIIINSAGKVGWQQGQQPTTYYSSKKQQHQRLQIFPLLYTVSGINTSSHNFCHFFTHTVFFLLPYLLT